MNTLKVLRSEIDHIDEQLVALIEKRTHIAASIGKIKQQNHIEILDCQREILVMKAIRKHTTVSIVQKHLEYIYKEIMTLAKATQ